MRYITLNPGKGFLSVYEKTLRAKIIWRGKVNKLVSLTSRDCVELFHKLDERKNCQALKINVN
jgi:hypothetical protein